MKNRILHQSPGGNLDIRTQRAILASTLKALRQQSHVLARDYLKWYGAVVVKK